MIEDEAITTYEERWTAWRRTFVLHDDRVEVTYSRWFGGRGQGTIPLDLVTGYREREWVKDEGLHGLVACVGLLAAMAISLGVYRFMGLSDLTMVAFSVPVVIVVATLAFIVLDPPRLDYVKLQLANGVFLRLGDVRRRVAERDAFVKAIETRVRARSDDQGAIPPPPADEAKDWKH
jgi:hypothetical protein